MKIFVCLFLILVQVARASNDAIEVAYNKIHSEAVRLAGAPKDIPQRVQALLAIYRDSGSNHTFPLVAAHGALWGKKYFKISGPIGEAISYRYFYDSSERNRRLKMLTNFAESFKDTNRQVFIDTYTNYYFTKLHAKEIKAGKFVAPELLKKLQLMHKARRENIPLTDAENKDVFTTALLFEQEMSVGPKIAKAIKKFDCPILRTLVLRPVVRFDYFPTWTAFYFQDFSDKKERIHYAVRAYELAQEAGWENVESLFDSDATEKL